MRVSFSWVSMREVGTCKGRNRRCLQLRIMGSNPTPGWNLGASEDWDDNPLSSALDSDCECDRLAGKDVRLPATTEMLYQFSLKLVLFLFQRFDPEGINFHVLYLIDCDFHDGSIR